MASGDGGEKTLHHDTIKYPLITTIFQALRRGACRGGPSDNTRMGAASPPPRGGSSGFARASCGPEPLLGHAGSTKFDRPQKRKRFWGARTSPTRGRYTKAPLPDGVSNIKTLVRGSRAGPAEPRKYHLLIFKQIR